MRFFVSLCCAAVLAGCSKPDATPAADTTAVAAPAPAPISLAEVAGKWTVRTMAENSDSVLVTSEMTATADTSGWVTIVPGRPPLPTRVIEVAGDSITTEFGPFESVLRAGVQVTTRTVMRLRDGKLVGTLVARYVTTGADSVTRLRLEATRAP
ncbi:MAG TPA: hypothetical protein VLB00_15990 [Gemmatimonadales bacterium]|nr:hypothetical protein [Gemmatimonadales bacterium]